MDRLLDVNEVSSALAGLPGWSGGPEGIVRTVRADSFMAGIALVNAVAEEAEAADHHPDIDIRWRDVTFRLSTHSAGGVTDKDISLANKINSHT